MKKIIDFVWDTIKPRTWKDFFSNGETRLFFLLIILAVASAAFFSGCKTLQTIKQETAAIRTELQTAVDSLGAELVTEIANKVKKEINRTRKKLPEKIRREIERSADRYLGLNINLRKPPNKKELAMAKVYVAHVAKTEKYKEIVDGNRPIVKETGNKEGVYNYTEPDHWVWEPSEELREDFFSGNPKVKTARKELQYLLMALWDLGADFVGYEAHRSCQRQKELYAKKVTQIKTCTGDHNTTPSDAVDLVPIEDGKALWEDRQQYCYYGGLAKSVYCNLARQHGWTAGFRWGGDFDRDNDIAEKRSFVDMPHFSISDKYPLKCGSL